MTADLPSSDEASSAWRRVFRWMFEDRRTGRIVVAQSPNKWVLLFLAAVLVDASVRPNRRFGGVVTTVRYASLTIWGLDEVVRGVNPWRRLLGLGALVYELVVLLTS